MPRKLTPAFVDSVRLPVRGERWIGDTEVRGFGLRLWSAGTGGKAYAVRFTDLNGKQTRRTIGSALGRLLSRARNDAKNLIRGFDGKKRRESALQRLGRKIGTLTLDQWVATVIELKRMEGANQRYVDQLDDTYKLLASLEIGNVKLGDIEFFHFQGCIERASSKPANARRLQSLFQSALVFAGRFSGRYSRIALKLKDSRIHRYDPHRATDARVEGNQWAKLFECIANEQEQRQQAILIALTICLGVRPKQMLRAKWLQFQGRYFVPEKKARWRQIADARKIDERLMYFLDEARAIGARIDPNSPYVFPSRGSRVTGHLTAYRKTWERIRSECGLPDEPLYEFVLAFDPPWFHKVRQWGFAHETARRIAETNFKI